jgi:hypothetical protein
MSWFHTNKQLRNQLRSIIIAGDAAAEKVVNQKYRLLEKASELAAYGHIFSANSLRVAYDEILRVWSAGATPYHRNNIDKMRRRELNETLDRLTYRMRMLERAEKPELIIKAYNPDKETQLRDVLQKRLERLDTLYKQMEELSKDSSLPEIEKIPLTLLMEPTRNAIRILRDCLNAENEEMIHLKIADELTAPASSKISAAIVLIASKRKP